MGEIGIPVREEPFIVPAPPPRRETTPAPVTPVPIREPEPVAP